MMFTENGIGYDGLRDKDGKHLPEGVKHGSMAAVRFGCTCQKCMVRRKKARKRGFNI